MIAWRRVELICGAGGALLGCHQFNREFLGRAENAGKSRFYEQDRPIHRSCLILRMRHSHAIDHCVLERFSPGLPLEESMGLGDIVGRE